MLLLLGVFFMIIDHVGYVFFPQYFIFHLIGRTSFPLFAYQCAVSLRKTSDIDKYFLRLILFAIIAEGPYYLLFHQSIPVDGMHGKAFVILDVLFSFAASAGIVKVIKGYGETWGVVVLLFMCFFFELIGVDYGAYGLIMVLSFYFLYDYFYFFRR